MEILMIQSRSHIPQLVTRNRTNKSTTTIIKMNGTAASTTTGPRDVNVTTKFDPLNNGSLYNFTYYVDTNSTFYWNQSDFNMTNNTDLFDNDYQMFNNNLTSTVEPWSGFCKDWTPAQHNLFQTANFFFAAAFLVPGSFKQSVLLVRYVPSPLVIKKINVLIDIIV